MVPLIECYHIAYSFMNIAITVFFYILNEYSLISIANIYMFSYFLEMSSGVVAFQARSEGFTGVAGAQIPFELVDVNIGDAYDPSGLFTAPVGGIYQISYEVMADNSCGTDDTCVDLTVNGVHIMRSCSEYAASGGSSTILQLVVGDTVSLNIGGRCYSLHDIAETYTHNQFSGHLLYEVL